MLLTVRIASLGTATGAVLVVEVEATTVITGFPHPPLGRFEATEGRTGWGLATVLNPTRLAALASLPAIAGRDKQASARLVARLGTLRPAGVRTHVVFRRGFDQ